MADESLLEQSSPEKPKRVIVRKKPVVVAKTAPVEKTETASEQPAASVAAPAESLPAPVVIDKPRRGRGRPRKNPLPAMPEQEVKQEAPEAAKQPGPASSAPEQAAASVPAAQIPAAQAQAAAPAPQTDNPPAQNQEARDDQNRRKGGKPGMNHGNKNGFQRNNNQPKGYNNGYQNQKKSISLEDVCIGMEEYYSHKDRRMMVGDLAQAGMSELKSVLCSMTGESPDAYFDYKKQDLVYGIIHTHIVGGGVVYAVGTLEVLPEGYGFLRSPQNSYLAGPEDVYVSSMHIRYLNLKTGDTIEGIIRAPKENEKYFALSKIAYVNNDDPIKAKTRVSFDSLTPLYPEERINLEVLDPTLLPKLTGMSNESAGQDVSMRIINMFCPIGKGQRALITAPPRTGKTIILQQIANAITANHPEITLMVLLVDERPEEVTDMRRNVRGEVIASTFDEQASRHVQVAEMVIEKAKRLVEHKQDVVILLDSITRLARAYNQTVPASGKILSGGVDSNALHKPKRFFGAARKVEEGGSLTIIASALIETGSRMDEVIFEEFKGTGNCELVLDRRMSERRIFPAINIKKSGTRREELLLGKDEAARIWILRNAINNFEDLEMTEFLIDKIRKTKNNELFLRSMNPGATPS
ncbi:MAG: transcription termination factor Rho [Spirochaetales bacterium]|nr:transcription termination factor Rho [Spirochaetales bacterium]